MPSRIDRARRVGTAAIAVIAGVSQADVVPQTSVAMLVDADSVVYLDLAPTEINLIDGVTFAGEEVAPDNSWRVDWTLNTNDNVRGEEVLTSSITAENFTLLPKRFTVVVAQPACGTETVDALVGGVVTMALVSDSDGGAVTNFESDVWSASFNSEIAATQFGAPFQLTASGKSIIQTSQIFGAPFPSQPAPGLNPGPAAIKVDFILTPGDRVDITSTLFVGNGKDFPEQPAPNPCPNDLNNDGGVNAQDLAQLLAAWGVEYNCLGGDLNGDFVINNEDIAILLADWGPCSP